MQCPEQEKPDRCGSDLGLASGFFRNSMNHPPQHRSHSHKYGKNLERPITFPHHERGTLFQAGQEDYRLENDCKNVESEPLG